MSKEQLVAGMICTEAHVNLSRWRTGQLRHEDWESISEALNNLYRAPIFIDDSAAMSPIEIRAKARRLKAEHNLGLVVVDYLQLMRGSARTENRVNEISEITRSLKGLAKELDLPVVACAQLSRAVEQRQDKRPMLSDLRESGQIEADADVVLFLYRDSYYQARAEEETGHGGANRDLEDDTEPDPTEVIISKQRNGPTGMVHLGFQRQFKRFVSLEHDDRHE
jgi:replicative DNA helicase